MPLPGGMRCWLPIDASLLSNPVPSIVRSVEVIPEQVLDAAPSPAQLDAFAKSQWEVCLALKGLSIINFDLRQALLLFLLGPDGDAGRGRRASAAPRLPPELVRRGECGLPCQHAPGHDAVMHSGR